MKRTLFTGCLAGIFALSGSGIMTGCGSPFGFGSAGNSGIDTVGSSDPLVMQTTDSSLTPALNYPNGSDTGVSLLPVFQWKIATGVSKYHVFMSGNSDFIVNTLIVNDLTNKNFDTAGKVLPYSATYYWVVCAIGANGRQAWSSVGHFTTQPLLPLQNAYVAQKFGMFIHFNMSTFARYQYNTPGGEWELGNEDENLFNPTSLNLGQWADVAKSAHCKYVVLTAKHHGGFCIWPSNGPWSKKPHGIAQSAWYQQSGKRDILREFVDSVRSRGMEPGFYYSVRDETNPPTLPMVLGQLTELLTNYGDIKIIWFDGWGWYVGYFQIPYAPVANLVHELNAKLGHHTIISENNHQKSLWNTEIVQWEIPIDGPPLAGNTLPSEGNEPIRLDNCWFWHPMASASKSTQFILNRISSANAVNATYLLDLTPDTTGLIPQYQVQAMNDIGTTGIQQGIIQP
jgi:Alpha-L-fucosidase